MLADELRGQVAALPLETACERGGWPGEPMAITVGAVAPMGADVVRVRVDVTFVEVVTGTCAPVRDERRATLVLELDRRGGTAVVATGQA